MESVEVNATFSEQGLVTPLSFKRAGRNYHVDKVGKRWVDESGMHFLVLTPLDRLSELVFSPATCRWHQVKKGREHSLG